MEDNNENKSALVKVIIKLRRIIKILSIVLPIIFFISVFFVGIVYLFDLLGIEVGAYDEISENSVVINDEKMQAIWDEFEKNEGTPYDFGAGHGNEYGDCLDAYDCSSWVIHCLAHTGIKTIPDTTASGLYFDYCISINVNDRQAGDLIFKKDTYDTGTEENISHVGIYMGTMTIDGETAEWVIEASSGSGVKLSRYETAWANSSNFYGFGRLKSTD